MRYTVFYYQAATDKSVSSDDGLVMEIDAVCDQLLPEIHPPDDFLGVVDVDGTTVQTAPADDGFWIEIPVADEAGSYGMTVLTREQMIEFFRHLPERFELEAFPSFTFTPW